MSDNMFYHAKVKVNGDAELVDLAKRAVGLLAGQGSEPQTQRNVTRLAVDGVGSTVEELLARLTFGTVEFAFEYCSRDAYELYENLLEAAARRGAGFGAVVFCSSSYGNRVLTYGDVRETTLDTGAIDSEWGTEACLSATINLGADELCEALSCERDGLWDALEERQFEDDGRSILVALLGRDAFDAAFGTFFESVLEMYSYDIEGDRVRLEFTPDDALFRGFTIPGYLRYRAGFERMANALALRGDSIELRWEGQLGGDGPAIFFSAGGFRALSIETGPNRLGDPRVIAYELG